MNALQIVILVIVVFFTALFSGFLWFAARIQDELQGFHDESLEYIEGRK